MRTNKNGEYWRILTPGRSYRISIITSGITLATQEIDLTVVNSARFDVNHSVDMPNHAFITYGILGGVILLCILMYFFFFLRFKEKDNE